MLVPMGDLLRRGQREGYAVPAFNFYNHPTAQGIAFEAESRESPVILMVSGRYVDFMGVRHAAALGLQAAEAVRTPVAVLLDHGATLELAEDCIAAGFSSVMIDGSRLTIADNTALTRAVVEFAHARGLSVEAELGAVGVIDDAVYGAEDAFKLTLVDPDQAAAFVRNTGIDALAPAIGTVHGLTKLEPRLDLRLLERVRQAVDIPLVLHGGSGLSDETVRTIIAIGVSKVNVGTEIKVAWRDGLQEYFATEKYEPRLASEAALAAVRKTVSHKIDVAGSAGKA
ncbi:MAG: class II fructose-bisphosphate aldolase family protein [Planctomycetes bacterium]|nr:class II fructose-bisphosphate aldolase family protein [Planctomycetota bacterium]MCD7895692.1 class II fructose-bisphosphate aldolase family protein [Planctomycetaceae bacterium]